MRKSIVGGNWKMNLTLAQGQALTAALKKTWEGSDIPKRSEVVLFPGFPLLSDLSRALNGSPVELGAQNLAVEERGAYTGEVSGEMLKSVGSSWVLVGHSERRKIYGESDKVVGLKLRRALSSGLRPLLCVGETLAERDGNLTQAVLKSQVVSAVTGLFPEVAGSLVIAYEPVWAIGTGRTATPAQAQEAHSWVRSSLRGACGDKVAESVRIQYGGSVTKDNAAELMACPDVDGALVGGASLKAESFAAIVAAAAAKGGR